VLESTSSAAASAPLIGIRGWLIDTPAWENFVRGAMVH
jgi:hypothetical protein